MSRLWCAALTMFVAARTYAQEPQPLAALGIPSLQAPTAATADLRLWVEDGPVVPHSFLRLQMFPDSTALIVVFYWEGLTPTAHWDACAQWTQDHAVGYCSYEMAPVGTRQCADSLRVSGVWLLQRSVRPETPRDDGRYLHIQRRNGSDISDLVISDPDLVETDEGRRADRVFQAATRCIREAA